MVDGVVQAGEVEVGGAIAGIADLGCGGRGCRARGNGYGKVVVQRLGKHGAGAIALGVQRAVVYGCGEGYGGVTRGYALDGYAGTGGGDDVDEGSSGGDAPGIRIGAAGGRICRKAERDLFARAEGLRCSTGGLAAGGALEVAFRRAAQGAYPFGILAGIGLSGGLSGGSGQVTPVVNQAVIVVDDISEIIDHVGAGGAEVHGVGAAVKRRRIARATC